MNNLLECFSIIKRQRFTNIWMCYLECIIKNKFAMEVLIFLLNEEISL